MLNITVSNGSSRAMLAVRWRNGTWMKGTVTGLLPGRDLICPLLDNTAEVTFSLTLSLPDATSFTLGLVWDNSKGMFIRKPGRSWTTSADGNVFTNGRASFRVSANNGGILIVGTIDMQ